MMETCYKDKEASMKGHPLVKSRTILAPKHLGTVITYKPLEEKKKAIHESVPMNE